MSALDEAVTWYFAVLLETGAAPGEGLGVMPYPYHPPFRLLFSASEFEYGDLAEKTISYSNFSELRERLAGLLLTAPCQRRPEDILQGFIYGIEIGGAEVCPPGSG
ncbi:MAG TPA: hypothetical protein VGG35_07935 [Streptosporangiaceae bacterium]